MKIEHMTSLLLARSLGQHFAAIRDLGSAGVPGKDLWHRSDHTSFSYYYD